MKIFNEELQHGYKIKVFKWIYLISHSYRSESTGLAVAAFMDW
jgi:hypothetical protein